MKLFTLHLRPTLWLTGLLLAAATLEGREEVQLLHDLTTSRPERTAFDEQNHLAGLSEKKIISQNPSQRNMPTSEKTALPPAGEPFTPLDKQPSEKTGTQDTPRDTAQQQQDTDQALADLPTARASTDLLPRRTGSLPTTAAEAAQDVFPLMEDVSKIDKDTMPSHEFLEIFVDHFHEQEGKLNEDALEAAAPAFQKAIHNFNTIIPIVREYVQALATTGDTSEQDDQLHDLLSGMGAQSLYHDLTQKTFDAEQSQRQQKTDVLTSPAFEKTVEKIVYDRLVEPAALAFFSAFNFGKDPEHSSSTPQADDIPHSTLEQPTQTASSRIEKIQEYNSHLDAADQAQDELDALDQRRAQLAPPSRSADPFKQAAWEGFTKPIHDEFVKTAGEKEKVLVAARDAHLAAADNIAQDWTATGAADDALASAWQRIQDESPGLWDRIKAALQGKMGLLDALFNRMPEDQQKALVTKLDGLAQAWKIDPASAQQTVLTTTLKLINATEHPSVAPLKQALDDHAAAVKTGDGAAIAQARTNVSLAADAAMHDLRTTPEQSHDTSSQVLTTPTAQELLGTL